ncbi:MAG TPA: NAD(P)/FAD-dependent oxidoreductase [Candidatus Dormibacteraeota bacterium]
MIEVAILGGGQAGLAVSRELTLAGVDHLVLERHRIGETWRRHWDAFRLVTPNWTLDLPGFPYAGDDPQGFVHRDEIVRYLEGFARSFRAPVQTGVAVEALKPLAGGGFVLETSSGAIQARQVVVATGAYQRPHRPPAGGEFPHRLLVIDAEDYSNPAALPPGRVLVVGSGQTGCQLAEDLHLAGREVSLAVGRAPWGPRRLEGLDIIDWLSRTNWFEHTLSSLANPLARLGANILITGRDGGHDLNPRVLQAMGVQLVGHLTGVAGGRVHFAPDLGESVAFGDERYSAMCKVLRDQLPAAGYAVPEFPIPEPFIADAPVELDLDGFGTVIFTSGFRPDYARWVHVPGAFDEWGFPVAPDGASTVAPGLYFVGVHFLRKRKSSLMLGVGEDAAIVARQLSGEPSQPAL